MSSRLQSDGEPMATRLPPKYFAHTRHGRQAVVVFVAGLIAVVAVKAMAASLTFDVHTVNFVVVPYMSQTLPPSP